MTLPLLPPPYILGLPDRYDRWRPHQDVSVARIADTDKRIAVLEAPVGAGKSITAIAAWRIWSERVRESESGGDSTLPAAPTRLVYVTSNLGLQAHLAKDFAFMRNIEGQSNYPCRLLVEDKRQLDAKCDKGPCHYGAECRYLKFGCEYFDAKRAAMFALAVVTNYAYWLGVSKTAKGLGPNIGMLVLDEGHDAVAHLTNAIRVTLRPEEVESTLDARFPPHSAELADWIEWAGNLLPRAERELELMVETAAITYSSGGQLSQREAKRLLMLQKVADKLSTVAAATGESEDDPGWVHEITPSGEAWFDPIWPRKYRESLLQNIPKVLIMSGTVRPKDIDLLGIDPSEVEWITQPSNFPRERRPVYSLPTVTMKYGVTDAEEMELVRQIDNILRTRLDRKTIIHTVSYKRAKMIFEKSEFARCMMLGSSGNTKEDVETFKSLPAPAVYLSPAVHTGYDFPYSECECQIIVKVPFASVHNSKVMAARAKADKRYINLLAMKTIAQATGRGMRAEDDQCETFILDRQWENWFWRTNRDFAAEWLQESVRTVWWVPPPPARLEISA